MFYMCHHARDFILHVKSIKILIFSVYTMLPTISQPIQLVADQSNIHVLDSESSVRPSVKTGTSDCYLKLT